MRITRILPPLAVAAMLATAAGAAARESAFTRSGKAPMYWIAYEQCFKEDRSLDETRWRANIDWVAGNLLPHGYDMICTDGWIEGGQSIGFDGYITKYNSGWGQDLGFYVKLAARKGLRSGIYYNPLWMTRAAYDANVAVKGSDRTSRQIAGKDKFNDFIYWVDTDQPGAEQWVKGYVRYFIDLGYEFLRVDFLNMYENAYGSVRYRRALKWIREEAGDEILISLVMPNSYDHASAEREYGDMFRISEDVFGGGFDFVSQRRRGQWQNGWANWGNIYDGFLDFSDIDRKEIMMDGDFIRLNTASTAAEKQFWISLLVMAGSPLAVADQYDTVGDNLPYLVNERLLGLVRDGFHGKPLSRDSQQEGSTIWTGKCANGDMVVALFNREEYAMARTLRLSDAGVRNLSFRTDLWSGETLRDEDPELKVRLGAHACKIFRFSATQPESGVAEIESSSGLSKLDGIYGLDGVKVASDPAEVEIPGIYIVVRDGNASKMMIGINKR